MLLQGSPKEILALYTFALFLSLWLAPIYFTQGLSVFEERESPANAGVLLIQILVFTAILLLLIKFFPFLAKIIFAVLESIAIFFATAMVLLLFLPEIPVTLLSLGMVLLRWKGGRRVKNAIYALSAAGIAGMFGASLAPGVSALFLSLAALYDYLAVFWTKHMVRLAKFLLGKRIPVVKREDLVVLGVGDVVLPALFCASVAAEKGIVQGSLTAISVLIGVLFLLTRRKRPLPGLPFLSLPPLLAYLFILLCQM